MILLYFLLLMIRFLFPLFILPFLLMENVFAECVASSDLTKPEFKICTSSMNPLQGNQNRSDLLGTAAFTYILGQIANILLFAIPLIAGISLIIAGYYYILSSGNTEKATQAKVIIKWNIVAMLVAFFSYALVSLVLYILKLQ